MFVYGKDISSFQNDEKRSRCFEVLDKNKGKQWKLLARGTGVLERSKHGILFIERFRQLSIR